MNWYGDRDDHRLGLFMDDRRVTGLLVVRVVRAGGHAQGADTEEDETDGHSHDQFDEGESFTAQDQILSLAT